MKAAELVVEEATYHIWAREPKEPITYFLPLGPTF
jgi:hypothetical protein